MRIFEEPATSDTVVLRRPEMLRRSSGRTVVGGVLAGAFCMGSVAVTLSGGTSGGHVRAAVLHGVIVAVAAGVGLWASSRTIYKRFGHLLLAAGLLWSLATLAEAHPSVLYSFGRIAGWMVTAGAAYLLLAFPDGKLVARSDRALAGGIAAVICLLYLPTALLVDAYQQQTPWALCRASCPANAFQVVAHEPAFVESVVVPLRAALT